jgi:hypothetical protein
MTITSDRSTRDVSAASPSRQKAVTISVNRDAFATRRSRQTWATGRVFRRLLTLLFRDEQAAGRDAATV